MKLTPVETKVVVPDDETLDDVIIECCDSYIAVLDNQQVMEWMNQYESHVNFDYTVYGSSTMVFDIDGKNLVVVSDSGGESASGAFAAFCEEHGIEHQFVIDSLDCTDVAVEDIYTGADEDNMDLLKLLHKVFN